MEREACDQADTMQQNLRENYLTIFERLFVSVGENAYYVLP